MNEGFQATAPLYAENLPHRPSTDHFLQNGNSSIHSAPLMFLAGCCPIRSKNSAQTGKFSVSSRFPGSRAPKGGGLKLPAAHSAANVPSPKLALASVHQMLMPSSLSKSPACRATFKVWLLKTLPLRLIPMGKPAA